MMSGFVRLGLVLGVCANGWGCLSDPPVFEDKVRIPPSISLEQVSPPVGEIYEGDIPVQIVVPFRSEDLNQALEARLFLNLPVDGSPIPSGAEVPVPAGHWEDEIRTVAISWEGVLQGCNSLTFVLASQQNFPSVGLPSEEAQSARVVWWLNTGDEDDEVRVDSCGRAATGATQR